MIGTVIGVVKNSGTTENGGWALIEEPLVIPRSGDPFHPRVMCGSKDAIPAVGTPVLVVGTARAEKKEHDGKVYANLTLSFCHFTKLAEAGATEGAARQVTEADFDDSEAPF